MFVDDSLPSLASERALVRLLVFERPQYAKQLQRQLEAGGRPHIIRRDEDLPVRLRKWRQKNDGAFFELYVLPLDVHALVRAIRNSSRNVVVELDSNEIPFVFAYRESEPGDPDDPVADFRSMLCVIPAWSRVQRSKGDRSIQ